MVHVMYKLVCSPYTHAQRYTKATPIVLFMPNPLCVFLPLSYLTSYTPNLKLFPLRAPRHLFTIIYTILSLNLFSDKDKELTYSRAPCLFILVSIVLMHFSLNAFFFFLA